MNEIPSARLSPRIVNGVLKFYERDIFNLTLELDIEDQDGEKVDIDSAAELNVVFLNNRREEVKTFTFTGIEGNAVTLDFDAECTARFKKGEYTYDIYYKAGPRTTLADENLCVVQ